MAVRMWALRVITDLARRFGLRGSVFKSRVARRVFTLFVFAALAPILLIAVLFYVQNALTRGDIERQRLHVKTRTMGQEFLADLRDARDKLRYLSSLPPERRRYALQHTASRQLINYAVFDHSGRIDGLAADYPPISTALRLRAAQGEATLLTQVGREGRAHLYMAISAAVPSTAVIIAELNVRSIGYEMMDDDVGQLCILSDRHRPIYCDERLPPDVLAALKRPSTTTNARILEWQHDGAPWKGGFWTVYTEPKYGLPSLTVLWGVPASHLQHARSEFDAILPPALAFALLIVVLLSINLIRRILSPLDVLKSATVALAGGDFACKVQAKSGDEFEELAGSFNTMASDIHRQFRVLETLGELDRRVLSAHGVEEIISILLGRLPEIAFCDMVEIAVVENDAIKSRESSIPMTTRLAQPGESDRKFLKALKAEQSHLRVRATDGWAPLRPLFEAGMRHVVCIPVRQQDALLAVISLGYRRADGPTEEVVTGVLGIADHAALAFSNAAWEEKLYHQAHYDSLTGLPNRQLFTSRLDEAIAVAKRHSRFVALLFIDVDRFKSLNDTLGHHVGDNYLAAAARAMQSCVGEDVTLARLGGDEFTVIIPDIADSGAALERSENIAERIRQSFLQPINIDGQDVALTASIGIAICPSDADNRIALARCADQAMYHVKEHGRNGWRYYSAELNESALERLALGAALSGALERGELSIHLQPQVNTRTMRLSGAEVLLRWEHPRFGMVPPDKFIPIAEQTGLIVDIGKWVLDQACQQLRAWQNTRNAKLSLAINVSALQMQQDDYVRTVLDTIRRHGVEPGLVELEVTESMCAEDVESVSALLKTLRGHGLSVSIDDFGTGYSSMRYLQHLPVDIIKIDQAFVRGLPDNSFNKAITTAILAMAENMHCRTVAEGVETEAQLAYLRTVGCGKLQGYYIAKPMPVSDFERWAAQCHGPDGEVIRLAVGANDQAVRS